VVVVGTTVVGGAVVGGTVVVGPAGDEVDVVELVLGAPFDGMDVLVVVELEDEDVPEHEQFGGVVMVELAFTLVAGG
jgi:hypothetical protein